LELREALARANRAEPAVELDTATIEDPWALEDDALAATALAPG
jgi:hypothetical protein